MLILLLISSLQASEPAAPPAPGTYEVLFCTRPCNRSDRSSAVATGVLVLDSVPLVSHGGFFLEKPNACFLFSRSKDLDSYAVLFPAGYTAWRLSDRKDSLTFDTYHSPDAYHNVRAALTDSGFVGVGHSAGAGAAEIHVPDEYVIGYRAGPPDSDRCPFVRRDRRSVWLAPLVLGAATVATFYVLLHSAHD